MKFNIFTLVALLVFLIQVNAQDCYKSKSAKPCRRTDGCSWNSDDKKCRKSAIVATPEPTVGSVTPEVTNVCVNLKKKACNKKKVKCAWKKGRCNLVSTPSPTQQQQTPATQPPSDCGRHGKKKKCNQAKNCGWNKKQKLCKSTSSSGGSNNDSPTPAPDQPDHGLNTNPSKIVCSGKSKSKCDGTKGCYYAGNKCKAEINCHNWPFCIGYHFNREEQAMQTLPKGPGLSCQAHDQCHDSSCGEDDPNYPCYTKGCLPHGDGNGDTCEEVNLTGGNGPRGTRYYELLQENVNCVGCETTTPNGNNKGDILMVTLHTCVNICSQLAPAGRAHKSCGRILYPHFDHSIKSEWSKKRECRLLPFEYQDDGGSTYQSGGDWDVFGAAHPPANVVGPWNSDPSSFQYSQELLDAAKDTSKQWYGWFDDQVKKVQKCQKGDHQTLWDSFNCMEDEVVLQSAINVFTDTMRNNKRICRFFVGKDQNNKNNKYTCNKLHQEYGCQLVNKKFPSNGINSNIKTKHTGGKTSSEMCGSLWTSYNGYHYMGAPEDIVLNMWPLGHVLHDPAARKCDPVPTVCYKTGGRFPCKYDCDENNCGNFNQKKKCPAGRCTWNNSYKLSNGNNYGRCEGTHTTQYV